MLEQYQTQGIEDRPIRLDKKKEETETELEKDIKKAKVKRTKLNLEAQPFKPDENSLLSVGMKNIIGDQKKQKRMNTDYDQSRIMDKRDFGTREYYFQKQGVFINRTDNHWVV